MLKSQSVHAKLFLSKLLKGQKELHLQLNNLCAVGGVSFSLYDVTKSG